jgi:hypothetical protein
MPRVPRFPRSVFVSLPLVLLPLVLLLGGRDRTGIPPTAVALATDGPCTECCTSLLAGKLATADGSTMTSHSCDSGTDRTWMSLAPHRTHGPGAEDTIWFEPKRTTAPNDPERIYVTTIAQVAETYKSQRSLPRGPEDRSHGCRELSPPPRLKPQSTFSLSSRRRGWTLRGNRG